MKRSATSGRRRFLQFERVEERALLDARVIISEFVAANKNGIVDQDGDTSDWIEIQNAGDAVADLSNWYLTDDTDELKWQFPAVSIEAGQFLVVFASGKNLRDPSSPLHTNFKLRSDGEYLALARPDQTLSSAYLSDNPQFTDTSFGIPADEIPEEPVVTNGRYFTLPTPGELNAGESYAGIVHDIQVSVPRGFYQAPQDISITTSSPGADIVYTLDGSTPSTTNGIRVASADPSQPPDVSLMVAQTTTLRAIAIKEDFLATPVATHTYVFVDDVIRQSPNGEAPTGWPSTRINGQHFNYGMDPDVVEDPEYAPQIKDALTDIPSFSIVTDLENLIDPDTGFFVNGQESLTNGRNWERPASIELIHPDGTAGFHINAGVRLRGGFSRRDDNPKHAFRLFFRSEYGDAKLAYPLFGDHGAQEFDNIDLRTAQVPSWSLCWPGAAATGGGCRFNTMVRDVFTRDIQRDMGQPHSRSLYYHLYLNGIYWGLFQTQERTEASYAESYFGGNKEDYDVLKVEAFPHHTVATDGNLDAWRELWNLAKAGFESDDAYLRAQGRNADGSRNLDYPVLLDVENLSDYMIAILYSGNLDGPISNFLANAETNNWFGIRDRTGDEGFKFFVHDAEWTLFDLDENRLGPWRAGETFDQSNPQWLHQQLMQNENYRHQFADRAHRHLFNDGVLTPAASLERLQTRIDQIELAIIAESARWGDTHRSRPYTKRDWQREIDRIRDDHIPFRTAELVRQLRNATVDDSIPAPLYPLADAPIFNQHGGPVPDGFEAALIGEGETYFTIDGTDPRMADPELVSTSHVAAGSHARFLVPSDDSLQSTWSLADFDDSAWSTGPTGIGFERVGQNFRDLIATNIETDMRGNNSSVYVRIDFDLDTLDDIDSLQLRLKYDDGFVAYLNGQEVARGNAPDEVQWDSQAARSRPNSAAVVFENFNLSPYIDDLQLGKNVLAIQGLNRGTNGSDFVLFPELIASEVIATGASLNAQTYSTPITITGNTIVKARSLSNGTWSALTEATFVVGTSPLRVSEIMYHPRDPSVQELSLGFTDENDFEFIEVVNTSSTESLNLDGIEFTQGIEFTFGSTVLAPGEYGVVARNSAAFHERYGTNPSLLGEYGSSPQDFRLNNRGELIEIYDALGIPIQSISYSEEWHAETDGEGHSLVFVGDYTNPTHWSDPSSWIASRLADGTPGRGPLAPGDSNGDGQFNSSDLVAAFQAGEYEDDISGNSTWAEGDWNDDGDFTTSDLVAAFRHGAYVQTSRLNGVRIDPTAIEYVFDGERRQQRNGRKASLAE